MSDMYGRSKDVMALKKALRPEHALVLVTGAPGVGKSHLVRQHLGACALCCNLRGCVTFSQLIDRLTLALQLPALTHASYEDNANELAQALQACEQVIVFDDADGVIMPLMEWMCGWSTSHKTQKIRAVVTSRIRHHNMPLHLNILEVMPLAVDAGVALYEDVASRMGAVQVERTLYTRRLVEQLDVLPAAIILAAKRAGVLTPEMMCARLSRRFELLRDVAQEHVAFEEIVAMSWELLDTRTQEVLGLCAVFEGGFFLSALEDLVDEMGFDDAYVIVDVLQELVLGSLVSTRLNEPLGEVRFCVLAGIRAFALMTLEPEFVARARLAHAASVARLQCIRSASFIESSCELSEIADRTLIEEQNIKAAVEMLSRVGAHDRAFELVFASATCQEYRGGLMHLLGVLSAFDEPASMELAVHFHILYARCLGRCGFGEEALVVCAKAQALVLGDQTPLFVRYALVHAQCLRDVSLHHQAEALLEDALEVAQGLGQVWCAQVLVDLGLLRLNMARFGVCSSVADPLSSARAMCARSERIASRFSNARVLAKSKRATALMLHDDGFTLQGIRVMREHLEEVQRSNLFEQELLAYSLLGALCMFARRLEDAYDALEQALRLCFRFGDLERAARTLCTLGMVQLMDGKTQKAEETLLDAIERSRRQEQHMTCVAASIQLMWLYQEQGAWSEAKRWLGITTKLADSMGSKGHQGLLGLVCGLDMARSKEEGASTQVAQSAKLLSSSAVYAQPLEAPRWKALWAMFEHMVKLLGVEHALIEGKHHKELLEVEQARTFVQDVERFEIPFEVDAHVLVPFRMLKGMLSRVTREHALPVGGHKDVVLVAQDGRWFERDGKRVSLGDREQLRCIFEALVVHWRPAPLEPVILDPTALIKIGWADEQIEHQSALNRVYAAIKNLRRLGLKGVLLTRDGGYLLDPDVYVASMED